MNILYLWICQIEEMIVKNKGRIFFPPGHSFGMQDCPYWYFILSISHQLENIKWLLSTWRYSKSQTVIGFYHIWRNNDRSWRIVFKYHNFHVPWEVLQKAYKQKKVLFFFCKIWTSTEWLSMCVWTKSGQKSLPKAAITASITNATCFY